MLSIIFSLSILFCAEMQALSQFGRYAKKNKRLSFNITNIKGQKSNDDEYISDTAPCRLIHVRISFTHYDATDVFQQAISPESKAPSALTSP